MNKNSSHISLKFNSKHRLHNSNYIFAVFTILLLTIAFLPIITTPVYAESDEEFKFEITTTTANQEFTIPTSSALNGIATLKPYNWIIDWNDDKSDEVTGYSSQDTGISHTYITAGSYVITITPVGSEDAWLGAFGFYSSTSGANAQDNKDMVTKIISSLTPLMTRTQTNLIGQTFPSYEWAYTFYGCRNLVMDDGFTFSYSWDDIKSVGNFFAYNMFKNCGGDSFTMCEGFNLPQGITSVGAYFVANMFEGCGGDIFTMCEGFNLPQGLKTVGGAFAFYMFRNCGGDIFTMCEGFNLPPDLTSVGAGFAVSMFSGCGGDSFTMCEGFNLPPNIETVGNDFAMHMFNECGGDSFTMCEGFNLPQGITQVGPNFASGMFMSCSGDAFAMCEGFNLPQGITTVDRNFATVMFFGCSGDSFTMCEGFNLPPNIETVAGDFASSMFWDCSGDAFAMCEGFNLPQGITKIGNAFAMNMFRDCSGDSFTMCEGFNLPQGIASVGDKFAAGMFWGCSGDAFVMCEGFNLPQGITTVGEYFVENMFRDCSGDSFVVNDMFVFPNLNHDEEAKFSAFFLTFYGLGVNSVQTRTAISIIGGNNIPSSDRQTFLGSACFVDQSFIPARWGGAGMPITVTYAPGTQGTWNDETHPHLSWLVSDTPLFTGDVAVDHEFGYVFDVWQDELGNVFEVDALPEKVFRTVTYTAIWREEDGVWSSIVFVNDDSTKGVLVGDLEFRGIIGTSTSDTIITPTGEPALGYVFAGWDAEVPSMYLDEDIVITGSWTALEFVVSFNSNGGSDPKPESKHVTFDAVYGPLPSVSRSGYTFLGWFTADTDGVKVTASTIVKTAEDHTLYAQWSLIVEEVVDEFTVTYHGNGNSGGFAPVDNKWYISGDKVTVLGQGSLVRAGYSFLGWATSPTTTTATYTVGSTFTIYDDIVLCAVWSPIFYTVTYQPGTHGTFTAQITGSLRYGDQTPTAPTVTSEAGWTFTGWSPTPTTTVTNNATYTAQWTQTTTPAPPPTPTATVAPTQNPTQPPTATASPTLPPIPTASPTPTTSPVEDEDKLSTTTLVLIAVSIILIAAAAVVFVLLSKGKLRRWRE